MSTFEADAFSWFLMFCYTRAQRGVFNVRLWKLLYPLLRHHPVLLLGQSPAVILLGRGLFPGCRSPGPVQHLLFTPLEQQHIVTLLEISTKCLPVGPPLG